MVGFGRMGRVHFDVATSLGWVCVGIIEPDFSQVEHLGGAVPLYDDIQSLPRNGADVLILASTTDVRTKILDDFNNWGVAKAIITEKPLANSLLVAHRIRDFSRMSQIPVLVNHNKRFASAFRYVSEMLSGRTIGELTSIQVSGSNFGMAMNFSHYAELASFFFQAPPTFVNAWLTSQDEVNPRGNQFNDSAGAVRVDFGNGRSLYADFPLRAAHGIFTLFNFEQGKIVVDDFNSKAIVVARGESDFEQPSHFYALKGKRKVVSLGAANIADTSRIVYGLLPNREAVMAHLELSIHALESMVMAHFSSERLDGGSLSREGLLEEEKAKIFPWP